MLWTFVGAVMTAVLAASVAFIVSRQTGRNIRWLIPVSAGAAMLGFTMWNDYTWFSRTRDALPESFVVTAEVESSLAIQPWTLAAPAVVGFATLDTASVRRHSDHPGFALADLYILQRYAPTRVAVQLIDCAGSRRADVPGNAAFGEDGLPVGLGWIDLSADDPLIRAACGASG